MPVEYETSATLDQLLASLLLYEEFAPLTQIGQFRFKAASKFTYDSRTEELIPCKGWRAELKKVSPLFRLYAEADYVLVVDAYTLANSDAIAVEAYAHRALMSLQVSMSDSGKLKVAKRPPDITEFRRTVSRYGSWNQDISAFQELLNRVGHQSAAEIARLVHANEET